MHGHGHSHGLVDPSIVRSRAGIRAVSLSLAVLAAAALAQTAVFLISDSVALPARALAPRSACGRRRNRLRRKRDRGADPHSGRPAPRKPSAGLADGNHARADGFVSLGVVASAALVALGAEIADPLIGLLITMVILKITWDSWRTVRGR